MVKISLSSFGFLVNNFYVHAAKVTPIKKKIMTFVNVTLRSCFILPNMFILSTRLRIMIYGNEKRLMED